jgi:CO/xanthine dehydrogenase FAD-binding subunit
VNLRDVNNAAFLHRERVRFRAGRSALLGIALDPASGDGVAIDVADVPELRAIATSPNGSATIGAFATLEELSAALPMLAPRDAAAANVRLRLALHGARVTVYGLGRTRTTAIEQLAVAAHELPATIDVPAIREGLGIAERRRATNDGSASFALGITAALRVSPLARFEQVRIFVDVDGVVRRATTAEARLEGERCDRDLIPDAARLAAASIKADDARSSAIARAIQPLVLAALRDAFEAARPKIPGNPRSSYPTT